MATISKHRATAWVFFCMCIFGVALYAQQRKAVIDASAEPERTPQELTQDRHVLIPEFQILSVEDGLPENSVTCILQDYLGYLWLGTQNGLVRYDGYTMDVFQPKWNDSTRISGRLIGALYEDRERNLWIGTSSGLDRFDRSNDSFKAYWYNPHDSTSINGYAVLCMYEDASGRFWVGTKQGLNLFDRQKHTFKRFSFTVEQSNVSGALPSRVQYLPVNAIIDDPSSDDLLIGTDANGLWRFNVTQGVFTRYPVSANSVDVAKIGWIQSFYRARSGKIWIASMHTLSSLDPQQRYLKCYLQFPISPGERDEKKGYFLYGSVLEDDLGFIWAGYFAGSNGVFCLDPETERWHQFEIYPRAPHGSRYNRVFALYQDRSGILWVGSWLGGLARWNRRANRFGMLTHTTGNANGLSDAIAYSMACDREGHLWLCTSASLDRYDPDLVGCRRFLSDQKSLFSSLYRIALDNSGDVWLGTHERGLIQVSRKDGSHHFYLSDQRRALNLLGKETRSLLFDHQGSIWIGTDANGLYNLDVTSGDVIHYERDERDSASLSGDQIEVLYEDRSGTLWVGTRNNGLNRFNRDTHTFTRCGFSSITVMHEDRWGNFWVADYYTGLNLFDRASRITTAEYDRSAGLASNAIEAIEEDDHGNLWMATTDGLSKFNTVSRTFKNFAVVDGLPDNRFRTGSCKSSRGEMFFNTESGVVFFHPDSLTDDLVAPQVVIKGVSLFNRPGERLGHEGFISELKEVRLPYEQNDLRFDFVGLQFSEPAMNRYRYFLQNFDNGWVDAGTQRNATYTNLSPGTYVFRVTASNRDGVWNTQGASVTIIIAPPWWETPWAYFLYAVFFIGALYLTWRMQLRRVRIRHALEMTRFQAEKLHEVDEMKSQFFTNISHEFRTPLTLILGPVRQLAEQLDDERAKEELRIVHRNAGRLLALVNQLLDVAKFESGTMKLRAVPQDMIPLLKGFLLSFAPYAERTNITLKFSTTEEELKAYVDTEKIEKVITNILSNALKFTPEGGIIRLDVVKDDTTAILRISDSGIGIPVEEMPRIFDRFYQVNGGHTREQEGTGIGLALTKELVELHKGSISVESEEGKGTVFTVRIPLGKGHLTSEEIGESLEAEERESELPRESISTEAVLDKNSGTGLMWENGKPIVLVVEDNADVRRYIRGIVDEKYSLLEASDGEEGWKKTAENIPDIVVSDIMMPKMDGFALCAKLKTDERTSHIPVILLTAKAEFSDKIQGLETGADEYIVKPFEPEELKVRIKNLLEQRRRIHEYFQRREILSFDDSKYASIDRKFLQKVFHIITENMATTSFNVESLAEMAAVSQSVLRRKIASLTGESPVELIRKVRLARAAELIKGRYGNISQIALEVGFTNFSYFSECFRKEFGVTPSHYPPK